METLLSLIEKTQILKRLVSLQITDLALNVFFQQNYLVYFYKSNTKHSIGLFYLLSICLYETRRAEKAPLWFLPY